MFTVRYASTLNDIIEITFKTLSKAIKFSHAMHSYDNALVEIISNVTGEIVFSLNEDDTIYVSDDVKYFL